MFGGRSVEHEISIITGLQLIKAMDKLQSQSTSNPNSIAQAAAVEALTGQQESVEEMRQVFEQRRDLELQLDAVEVGHRRHFVGIDQATGLCVVLVRAEAQVAVARVA